MELLKRYFQLQEEIYNYFGYKEDWVTIPIDDRTDCEWMLIENPDQSRVVIFAEKFDIELIKTGNYYEDHIYTQRFLPKWVYRGAEYTMIVVDPRVDGNHYLAIFDNKKETTDIGIYNAWEIWKGRSR